MNEDKMDRIGGTMTLVGWLADQQQKLTPVDFDELLTKVQKEIEYWVDRIKAVPTGAQRAIFIHRELDKAVEKSIRENKGPVSSCKKRCNFCCHIHVAADHDEAALLADWVKRSGYKVDMERLRRQATIPNDASYIRDLTAEEARCVFLGKDGLCAAYKVRPSSCRKYLVGNDPKRCNPFKFPEGGVAVVIIPSAEIIASAAISIYGGTGDNLAQALLPLLEKEDG